MTADLVINDLNDLNNLKINLKMSYRPQLSLNQRKFNDKLHWITWFYLCFYNQETNKLKIETGTEKNCYSMIAKYI